MRPRYDEFVAFEREQQGDDRYVPFAGR